MNLKYKIRFVDFWHCSNGMSGGSKYDAGVLLDRVGIPFVPGKTIKGLGREFFFDKDIEEVCFGKEECEGVCHLCDAVLGKDEAYTIQKENLQEFLKTFVSCTAIEENGRAKEGSLREIEVVIPLVLYGEINNVPQDFVLLMQNALKSIKRIGLNRTRGLGRCEIIINEGI